MKKRKNKVKREHTVLKEIIHILEKITLVPGVASIIPGRIKPIKGNHPAPYLSLTVSTESGYKCIAKSSRAVQEIFIVTTDSTCINKLKEMNLIRS